MTDPLDAKATTLQGRGKRITLRDGSESPRRHRHRQRGQGHRPQGRFHQQYVRVPTQKRIYGVNIKAEPSTRFADWIETNSSRSRPAISARSCLITTRSRKTQTIGRGA